MSPWSDVVPIGDSAEVAMTPQTALSAVGTAPLRPSDRCERRLRRPPGICRRSCGRQLVLLIAWTCCCCSASSRGPKKKKRPLEAPRKVRRSSIHENRQPCPHDLSARCHGPGRSCRGGLARADPLVDVVRHIFSASDTTVGQADHRRLSGRCRTCYVPRVSRVR